MRISVEQLLKYPDGTKFFIQSSPPIDLTNFSVNWNYSWSMHETWRKIFDDQTLADLFVLVSPFDYTLFSSKIGKHL